MRMDNDEYRRGGRDPEWTKESGGEKREFDFDAFLQDDLEERITAALDGKDIFAPDAFGESVENYTPRRPADGEHGRHEAPQPVSTAQVADSAEEPPMAAKPNDPRYAAPERPRVVVAEPRPEVYVTPPGTGGDEPTSGGDKSRKGLIWAIVILAVIAVVIGILLAILRSGSRPGDEGEDRPVPTSQSETTPSPTADDATSAPVETPAEPTPTPTAPPQKTYRITVTAGSGGSVTPSGAVSVEEGGEVTFTILPNAGYELSQLLLDGSAIDLTDTIRIANVSGDHTLYAVFREAATPTPEPTPTPTAEPTATPKPTPEPTAPPAPDGGESAPEEPAEP